MKRPSLLAKTEKIPFYKEKNLEGLIPEKQKQIHEKRPLIFFKIIISLF
jgi:hypothetical protein